MLGGNERCKQICVVEVKEKAEALVGFQARLRREMAAQTERLQDWAGVSERVR